MTDKVSENIRKQPRFRGIAVDPERMAGSRTRSSAPGKSDEALSVEALLLPENNGKSTRTLEQNVTAYTGAVNAVAVNAESAALHLAIRLAAEKLYGQAEVRSFKSSASSLLKGRRVFCQDLAPVALADAILYEKGEPVFVDVAPEDWCMDPQALEEAFLHYPDVRIVMMYHMNGFPGQVLHIRDICREHGALLIEDAGGALGAKVWASTGVADESGFGLQKQEGKAWPDKADSSNGRGDRFQSEERENIALNSEPTNAWRHIGTIGDYGVIGFHGDNPVGDVGGGMLLTKDAAEADRARKLAGLGNDTDSAEGEVPWQQIEEIRFDYRMNELQAELICRRLRKVDSYINKKKFIYERYAKRLDTDAGLMEVNPIGEGTAPGYCRTAMTVESGCLWEDPEAEDAGKADRSFPSGHGTVSSMEVRGLGLGETDGTVLSRHGTTSPMEIQEALEAFGVRVSLIDRPLHMQPLFRGCDQISLDGSIREDGDGQDDGLFIRCNESARIFHTGLYLPCELSMTSEEQERIMDIIYACFDGAEIDRQAWM